MDVFNSHWTARICLCISFISEHDADTSGEDLSHHIPVVSFHVRDLEHPFAWLWDHCNWDPFKFAGDQFEWRIDANQSRDSSKTISRSSSRGADHRRAVWPRQGHHP